ncbi:MAG TPA: hypothetical protein VGQ21_06265 [Thermoanaerobaculia bacterium]|nr:hypothetical protein [Thermoanaerobaculia bacterium]
MSVTMTAGGCVSHGSSVIALHDPFNVRVAPISAAHAGEPLTLSWTYSGGSPARQTITGSDFGAIMLAPAVRTYTYSPDKSGTKQIVIDAAMDAPVSTPASSRQRAVAKSPASASSCAQLHTALPYTVGECVAPSVVIDAPDVVVKEKSFHVTVRSQPGAVAFWTITNGSPATATGEDVTITAGSSGNVGVTVQLTRGACGDQAARSIPILAEAVCDHPTAVVSAGPVSCGSAIVNVSFTGTAPFKGTWSDGLPFTATGKSFTRTVTHPFSYSINYFEDVMCAGTSSGVAVMPEPHPTATFTATGNGCVGVDTITATFTGTPPFTGQWNDGVRTPFQTNSMVISRPIFVNCVLSYAALEGHDSTGCPIVVVGATPIAHVPDRVSERGLPSRQLCALDRFWTGDQHYAVHPLRCRVGHHRLHVFVPRSRALSGHGQSCRNRRPGRSARHPEGVDLRIGVVIALVFAICWTPLSVAQEGAKPDDSTAGLPAPFGIRMGASKQNVGKIDKEVAPFMFRLTTVPKPHTAFESYIVQITPKAGVCFVKAIGRNVRTSAYGSELRSEFDKIREQLEGVYGKPKIFDFLRDGSIWSEPREWMMSLYQKERLLGARWSEEDGLITKYGINKVFLGSSAASTSEGYIVVEYYFSNTDLCESEVKEAQKSVF